MRVTLIVFTLIFLGSPSFAQKHKIKLEQKLNSVYQRYNYQTSDLIVPVDVYNPTRDTTISSIKFLQDTLIKYRYKKNATIDLSQSKSIDYKIGMICDFRSYSDAVSFFIQATYSDGSTKTTRAVILYNDTIYSNENTGDASYETNVIINYEDRGEGS